MTPANTSATDVLTSAANQAGINSAGATVIRAGSNVLYRLPDGIVARIGKVGTHDVAEREVSVSRWISAAGMPVIRAIDNVPQPTLVDNRPVTWWELLPDHRPATTAELGAVLRDLHALSRPQDLRLPVFDPLDGLGARIAAATQLAAADRDWLAHQLDYLERRYSETQPDEPTQLIHGDAWQGNVAVDDAGVAAILDLEHVSLGHPDWDLIPVAVDHADFARLTATEYRSFVAAYGGRDVTATREFRLRADIQLVRWVCFVLEKSSASGPAAQETQHRIACLRGDVSRPWTWTAF